MFKVEIKETSKELTAKERIAIKDTTNAVKLDAATQEGTVTIDPAYYAVLNVLLGIHCGSTSLLD